MTKPWYHLDLEVDQAIASDYVWPTPEKGVKRREWFYPEPNKVLTDTWLNKMTMLGAPVSSVIVFYRTAFSDHGFAHVDVNANRYVTTCAVNWAYGGELSEMVWYDMPTGVDLNVMDVSLASGKTHSYVFPIDTLTETHRCMVGQQPTLVRTNVPHAVFVGPMERWSISVRFGGRFAAWDDAVLQIAGSRSHD